jgi:hypothetical protein
MLTRQWKPTNGDTVCQACMGANPMWWVPSELWNEVMNPDRSLPTPGGDPGGILCPTCFLLRADELGIGRVGAWQLYPPATLK